MAKARILADTRRAIGAVNPHVFGGFIEHLGRCIYDGIFEEGSPLSDRNGFRTDVLEALRGLDAPSMRWPGGNFASNYHWRDGLGPREDRPRRRDLAWDSTDSNRFGTDEYIKLCRLLDTEPFICVNLGNGTPEEAADWVEYCNSDRPTSIVQWRKENGAAKPYGVKYWCLGNEMDGPWQVGHCDAAEYARRAGEAARQMIRVDKSIKMIACGAVSVAVNKFDWDLEVLRKLYDWIDYLSLHVYLGNPDYYAQMGGICRAARRIDDARAAINVVQGERRYKRRIEISFDEWNVWYRTRGDNKLEEHYNLRDALQVGTFMNLFLRNADILTLANLAQMVNVIAPIFTSPEGLFLQTIYHPIQLYRRETGDTALDIQVETPTFRAPVALRSGEVIDAETPAVAYLDAAATYDSKTGETIFHLVNVHRDEPMEISIELTGRKKEYTSVTYTLLAHDDPDAVNSFEAPNEVVPAKARTRKVRNGKLLLKLPKHSMAVARVS